MPSAPGCPSPERHARGVQPLQGGGVAPDLVHSLSAWALAEHLPLWWRKDASEVATGARRG
jgi:hypothetical protein